jgi:hypothetical protein
MSPKNQCYSSYCFGYKRPAAAAAAAALAAAASAEFHSKGRKNIAFCSLDIQAVGN